MSDYRVQVNPDLIQHIDSVPDTKITLVGGEEIFVQEDAPTVSRLILNYRAAVLAKFHEFVATNSIPEAFQGDER